MEKRSTKIAYLVAIACIALLLAVLGMKYANAPIEEGYETPFAATF